MEQRRCFGDARHELMCAYHDEEWGVPTHDDRKLFEMLNLESFQAGLSWMTVLNKRENFRAAFDGFDPVLVAGYGEDKVAELMQNAGLIRNRRKIDAAITNAKVFLAIQQEFGSFDAYIWHFTGGQVVVNEDDAPRPRSELSDAVSADLRGRGMKFQGTVIVYAYLQSIGVINDHMTWCFRHRAVSAR